MDNQCTQAKLRDLWPPIVGGAQQYVHTEQLAFAPTSLIRAVLGYRCTGDHTNSLNDTDAPEVAEVRARRALPRIIRASSTVSLRGLVYHLLWFTNCVLR